MFTIATAFLADASHEDPQTSRDIALQKVSLFIYSIVQEQNLDYVTLLYRTDEQKRITRHNYYFRIVHSCASTMYKVISFQLPANELGRLQYLKMRIYRIPTIDI
jgi:hypothetical protein